MDEPAVLVGVDIVAEERVAEAARRGGATFGRWLPAPESFPITESFIKAVGGRAPGFRWDDFEPAGPVPPGAAGLLEEAAACLTGSTGLSLPDGAAYTIRRASRRAALTRLAARGEDPPLLGAARWGRCGGLLVALAIVLIDERLPGEQPTDEKPTDERLPDERLTDKQAEA
ncbi:hypothetical protein [Nonomuraea insulae]|uniref:4'-phosphopantetheinyl transferase superfamily protein n=1 Tax=Nonomuraea insulae TaxID=1616787 RepID=A0ABW1DBZ1_9ACTN